MTLSRRLDVYLRMICVRIDGEVRPHVDLIADQRPHVQIVHVDDVRESPAVEIMELLTERGAEVAYSDPHVSVFPKMRQHQFDLASEDMSADNIASFDAVILTTDHDAFDYELIAAHATLIVDTRGRFREPDVKIIKA